MDMHELYVYIYIYIYIVYIYIYICRYRGFCKAGVPWVIRWILGFSLIHPAYLGSLPSMETLRLGILGPRSGTWGSGTGWINPGISWDMLHECCEWLDDDVGYWWADGVTLWLKCEKGVLLMYFNDVVNLWFTRMMGSSHRISDRGLNGGVRWSMGIPSPKIVARVSSAWHHGERPTGFCSAPRVKPQNKPHQIHQTWVVWTVQSRMFIMFIVGFTTLVMIWLASGFLDYPVNHNKTQVSKSRSPGGDATHLELQDAAYSPFVVPISSLKLVSLVVLELLLNFPITRIRWRWTLILIDYHLKLFRWWFEFVNKRICGMGGPPTSH